MRFVIFSYISSALTIMVSWLEQHLVKTEISHQLLDGSWWNLGQRFIVPRGWIPLTLVIPWLFTLAPPGGQSSHLSTKISKYLINRLLQRLVQIIMAPRRWSRLNYVKLSFVDPQYWNFLSAFDSFWVQGPAPEQRPGTNSNSKQVPWSRHWQEV